MTLASDEPDVSAVPRFSESRAEGDEDFSGTRDPLLAPLMARTVVAVVFGGFCAVAFLFVVDAGYSAGMVALAGACLVVLFAFQLFYFGRPHANLRSPLTYAVVVVQAALVFLPWAYFEQAWVGLPSLLAGTLLLVLPPVSAWPVFAAVAGVVALVQYQLTGSGLDVGHATVGTIVVGVEVYCLTRLAGLIIELHAARAELAEAAVAHERLRFARDLHDLLGLSLSAIAQRGELVLRLVGKDAKRTGEELAKILEISRRALADVRAVAHGYRDLSLDEVSRTAESVLSSSLVDVRMELNHGDLPVRIRTLLAAVLREAVANVLKHSDAERCDIIMSQAGDSVSLDIVNDGVGEQPEAPHPGGGLDKLSDQVSRLGGTLTSGLDDDGRFALHLTVPVGTGEDEDGPADTAEQAPRFTTTSFARTLVAVVFGGIFVQNVLRLRYLTEDYGTLALISAYMFMLVLIQLFYFSRPATTLRSPASYVLLAVQAVLVHLPLIQYDFGWLALPAFLAGSVLLVLRPVVAWAAFVVIVAIVGWVQAAETGRFLDVVYSAAGVVISGLVVYGLTWMVRSMTEMRAARIQLARVAVARERLRFARDLHDLLGLSLSAITLKTELVQRLVGPAPERAREQMTEILGISRLALTDVRLVATGYGDLSLSEEIRTAESLLSAADVDVRLDMKVGGLPEQVGTLLATVLREGVTNVLRHSRGQWCRISVEQGNHVVCLDIVNDGVTQGETGRVGGSGISNLSYRVGLLGGELTARVEPDGRFRLLAKVPT